MLSQSWRRDVYVCVKALMEQVAAMLGRHSVERAVDGSMDACRWHACCLDHGPRRLHAKLALGYLMLLIAVIVEHCDRTLESVNES